MPTPFTDTQRDTIRARLMDAARRHFAERGIGKTPLVVLTDAAGIAKSSFYAFFDSKEELCLVLLGELAPDIERRVVTPALQPGLDPHEAITGFLRGFLSELRTQPLLRRLLADPDDLRRVAERVGPVELEVKARAVAPLHTFVARAQAEGRLRDDVSPEVVVGALRAVTLLELHPETLAPHQEEVIELMIDMVAAGLARPGWS